MDACLYLQHCLNSHITLDNVFYGFVERLTKISHCVVGVRVTFFIKCFFSIFFLVFVYQRTTFFKTTFFFFSFLLLDDFFPGIDVFYHFLSYFWFFDFKSLYTKAYFRNLFSSIFFIFFLLFFSSNFYPKKIFFVFVCKIHAYE